MKQVSRNRHIRGGAKVAHRLKPACLWDSALLKFLSEAAKRRDQKVLRKTYLADHERIGPFCMGVQMSLKKIGADANIVVHEDDVSTFRRCRAGIARR